MAWEYEDLFDARVQDADVVDLQAEVWKSEPTAVRVGKMGYRTETTVAGERLKARVYPIFGRNQTAMAREAKKHQTREAQERANHARSIRNHILLAEANFTSDDCFLHMTYKGEETPDEKRCRQDINNFLRRVKRIRAKRGLPELKYIYAMEGGDGQTRAHVHMLISGGIERDELEQIWRDATQQRGGRCRTDRLETEEGRIESAVIYMAKELWAKGLKDGGKNEIETIARTMAAQPGKKRRWCTSRNLKKPKTRTSDSKCSNARVKRIAADFRNEAKEVMEKLYPGYRFIRCAVYYSDMVDGVYIRAVMRKAGGIRRG